MTKKTLFSPAFEKGHFYGLVDEGEYLRQSLLYKQILPSTPSWQKNCVNQRNLCPRYPRLINDLRLFDRLYNCRETFTDVMSALQIHLFMQNKAKFRKSQINVTALLTREYVQMDTWSIRKKQSQTNPNKPKTNPILADKKPIRTQFKPKQTQFYNPVCLQISIFPASSLINPINQICCVWTSSVSLDSAKMALYKGNWNLKKERKKKLNLLNYKELNNLSRMCALTGTLFAYSYAGIFVLNN